MAHEHLDFLHAGSHAAHMIARSGVGRLRLIDFDQVSVCDADNHAPFTRKAL